MKNSKRVTASLVSLLATGVFAQAPSSTGRPEAASSAAAPAAGPSGLAALSDDQLIADLAKRNLPTLLERAFEQNNWSQDRRRGVLAVMAAEQLRAKASLLTFAQKQALVRQVTQGISAALPQIRDGEMLYRSGETLLADGIRDDIALLEYWGASATTQVRVRPVIDAVVATLDRATQLATEERAETEKKMERATQLQITLLQRRYGQLEELSNNLDALRIEVDYNLALSLDKADPTRASALGRVVDTLLPLDTQENPARNTVRFVLAKAQLAEATSESLASARLLFDAIIKTPAETDSPGLPFEARYFRAVVEVAAAKLPDAQKQLADFQTWATANKPADANAAASLDATLKLLQYRVVALSGNQDQARQTLLQLVDSQPQFREVILQQLLSGVDQNTPMASLDGLILTALLDAGRREAARPETEKADATILSRATLAARELISRKDKPQVRADQIEEATFLLPYFLQRSAVTSPDKLAAANAFLDYAEKYRTNTQQGPGALDNAMSIVGLLRQEDVTDPEVGRVYDRVFPIALSAPYNRRELLFTWAERLRRTGKAQEAVTFFRQIPNADRNFGTARYLMLITLAQQLDTIKTGDSQRKAIVDELQTLAGEVREAAKTMPGDPQQQAVLRERLVRTNLLSADLARVDQQDPKKALAVLKDFERDVAGMPQQETLLGEAMFLRVQSYMQLGQTDQAVKQLVELLQTSGGERGQQVVFNMLSKLESDFTQAQVAGDRPRMAQLQGNRAALTPYLVQWARTSTDANINKFTYSYRVYDAETQRLAADFITDASQQRTKREESLAQFKELDGPDGFKQFQATLTPERLRTARYDVQVALGVARTEFDLENFAAARDRFGRLLADKTLGLPVLIVIDAGQEREVDNDNYWEAVYKWSRASVKTNTNVENVKTTLRSLAVRWGDRVGGSKWKSEFEALSKELLTQ